MKWLNIFGFRKAEANTIDPYEATYRRLERDGQACSKALDEIKAKGMELVVAPESKALLETMVLEERAAEIRHYQYSPSTIFQSRMSGNLYYDESNKEFYTQRGIKYVAVPKEPEENAESNKTSDA